MFLPGELEGLACCGSISEGGSEGMFDKRCQRGSLGHSAAFRLAEQGIIDVERGSHA
jgi:hypothetical protein